MHVVCDWIGNNEAAREHYLQVTDDHFAAGSTQQTMPAPKSGTLGSGNGEEREGTDANEKRETPQNGGNLANGSDWCVPVCPH